MTTNIKLLDTAIMPTRGTNESAGYDLSAFEDVEIESNKLGRVRTGVFLTCPIGTYGRIAPRSGLAYKNQIDVFAGVIDRDYKNEIMVLLFNHSSNVFKIKKNDRIAQLIFENITHPTFNIVTDLDLDGNRIGGFGSTGE
jgi:dUTP pyrophosphatase